MRCTRSHYFAPRPTTPAAYLPGGSAASSPVMSDLWLSKKAENASVLTPMSTYALRYRPAAPYLASATQVWRRHEIPQQHLVPSGPCARRETRRAEERHTKNRELCRADLPGLAPSREPQAVGISTGPEMPLQPWSASARGRAYDGRRDAKKKSKKEYNMVYLIYLLYPFPIIDPQWHGTARRSVAHIIDGA